MDVSYFFPFIQNDSKIFAFFLKTDVLKEQSSSFIKFQDIDLLPKTVIGKG